MVLKIQVPLNRDLSDAKVGTKVEISGIIYTARDAVIPKISDIINQSIESLPFNLVGAAIMHTAVSPAGYGPTSSNKEDIEGYMGILSKAGVKVHIGKGVLNPKTVCDISKHGSIFIVMPPVSALLQDRLIAQRIVAFQEEGMEAIHELEVDSLPGIIAAANGKSIFH